MCCSDPDVMTTIIRSLGNAGLNIPLEATAPSWPTKSPTGEADIRSNVVNVGALIEALPETLASAPCCNGIGLYMIPLISYQNFCSPVHATL